MRKTYDHSTDEMPLHHRPYIAAKTRGQACQIDDFNGRVRVRFWSEQDREPFEKAYKADHYLDLTS